ncbi:MAG: acetate/propionate family kinase [Pseudomonadota bacterium]
MAGLNVLVVNAGSTSLKLSLVDDDDRTETPTSLEAAAARGVDAVGHRVVHGGERFVEPVVVDDDVLAELEGVTELAPLHNPPSLEGLLAARRALPDRPHVAVFDTAFHATLPPEASTYALPARWRRELGLRRYGFQGISAQWASERMRVPRLVVCHLGGGSSVTAVLDGRSVDTTMGLTPLEGLPMATRSGSVDPGLLLYVLRHGHVDLTGLEHALQQESGLLGLSERSRHVHELEAAEAEGDERAALALAVYARRVAQAVAAAAAALGGLDGLVFTAGTGERSPGVRRRVCERLAFLGVELDDRANEAAAGDAELAAPGSRVRVAVVASREDLVIARAVRRVLAAEATA